MFVIFRKYAFAMVFSRAVLLFNWKYFWGLKSHEHDVWMMCRWRVDDMWMTREWDLGQDFTYAICTSSTPCVDDIQMSSTHHPHHVQMTSKCHLHVICTLSAFVWVAQFHAVLHLVSCTCHPQACMSSAHCLQACMSSADVICTCLSCPISSAYQEPHQEPQWHQKLLSLGQETQLGSMGTMGTAGNDV